MAHMVKKVQFKDHVAIYLKIAFLVSSNRVDDTSVSRLRCSTRCRDDHERSVATACIRELLLSLKIFLFLYNLSDQIITIVFTLISSLNLVSTPLSQLWKIFALLRDGIM
jgi:hypothetical protein